MNRLKDSTSPYLLQHANNPVDWYPWGDEAFRKAKEEDKPVLLSIGYSSCHWCHVMAHESFEDPETADIMNRHFVSIKVDREERPDIDDIYMQATLMFNHGSGGWPMTVFLMPDGRPFHAGTYYPKHENRGMPSFRRVMAAVLEAYRNRRSQVEQIAAQVTADLQREQLALRGSDDALNPTLLEQAYQGMIRDFDSINGGLTRGQPKFPMPMDFEFLLRTYIHTGEEQAREIVTFSLNKIAHGGIYDHIGGGFHRYSVDERWFAPHFEKMLYDNAQLSRLYLHTWQATGDEFFKRIATETYDYIVEEMTSPDGGFFSSTDADSEGEEGKFFLWTPEEMMTVLTEDEARAVANYWDVTSDGNFEGKNILHEPVDENVVADKLGISVEQLRARIGSSRQKLYAIRKRRVPPSRDDKILTAWNGLMLASFADASRALNRDDYKLAAVNNAKFLLENMLKDGRLLHSYKDGEAHINGYLEDYANFIDGLLALYQATFEPKYFTVALELADTVLKHFAASDAGFFDTSDDHETLIARPRNLQDNAMPSGNSMMAKVLLLLSAYTGEERFYNAAQGILRQLADALREYPSAFGEALNAADLLIRGIKEAAVVGAPDNPATYGLLEVINSGYRPNLVLALSPEDAGEKANPPLLALRSLVNGSPAAYVCEHFVCQRPVTDPIALKELLKTETTGKVVPS